MALRLDTIPDLVKNLLPTFERGSWVDINFSYQRFIAAALMMKYSGPDKGDHLDGRGAAVKRINVESGVSYDWRVRTTSAGNASAVGLWESDPVTGATDLFQSASIPMKFQQTYWSYDEREDLFNKAPAVIVDTLKARKAAAYGDMAELNEQFLWTNPADTNSKNPFGIPYWVVKNSSATPGFNGTNPSGFTSGAAGISSTSYPNWANWTFTYSAVTIDDFVSKASQANYKTDFYSPISFPDLITGIQRVYFTTFTVVDSLRKLGETRNDNLGYEMIAGARRVTIGGNPVIPVPYLDATDSTNPVYAIDFDVFRPVYNPKWDMREKMQPATHTTWNVFYDTCLNYACWSRRNNWVAYIP